jgi:hypothetical protein
MRHAFRYAPQLIGILAQGVGTRCLLQHLREGVITSRLLPFGADLEDALGGVAVPDGQSDLASRAERDRHKDSTRDALGHCFLLFFD